MPFAKNEVLNYRNSYIYNIVPGEYIEGGDIVNNDGTGGASIYGNYFENESYQRRHSMSGLVSMINIGKNRTSSRFLITLKSCPELDGVNVVIG